MSEQLALPSLTLPEVSILFWRSFDSAYPKASRAIEEKMRKLSKAKVSTHKWVHTYEIITNAPITFYCQKVAGEKQPLVSIGMIHRAENGLLLFILDTSSGGIPTIHSPLVTKPERWLKIFTAHACKRYAQRITGMTDPDFLSGVEAIMYSDMLGPVRITDYLSAGIEEIEFQFREGQTFGWRDSINHLTYFRTFYSQDMLKGDRKAFQEEWKDDLANIYKLFGR